MLSWFSSLSSEISLMAVDGTPSSSCSSLQAANAQWRSEGALVANSTAACRWLRKARSTAVHSYLICFSASTRWDALSFALKTTPYLHAAQDVELEMTLTHRTTRALKLC